ncbi:MAG: GyrI-like domain-containing protein [Dysgonomonas sp.]
MQESEKYTKQINIVIDYISANITQALDIKILARLTNLSPYHFHRIFSSIMGESPIKYVTRRRLELSATYLINDYSKSVTNIAYEVGFNSSNVFCRNFKSHFGMTAEEYRSKIKQENSKNRTSDSKINPSNTLVSDYFCNPKILQIRNMKMDCIFEVKQLDSAHVVYHRHYGPYFNLRIAFEKLLKWAYPRGLISSSDFKLAVIYHDNPAVTDEEKLTSDACLIVDKPVKADREFSTYSIKEGQYATGRFEIIRQDFKSAWQCMYSLIDDYGLQCCGLPFEIYHNNSEEHPEKKWIVDICIPVTAK